MPFWEDKVGNDLGLMKERQRRFVHNRDIPLKIKFLHGWHGCAKFNRLHPHWQKTEGRYPRCTVCDGRGWWMWGYKQFLPDRVAQEIQGTPPDLTDRYWAKHDGHLDRTLDHE